MERQKNGLWARIKDEIYTCCAFWIAVSSLPALAGSYSVVRISKYLWLKLLTSRYPHLEFIRNDTVRSLLDTHRNQGIINVLLCIKGSPDVEDIKQHLAHHVLDRRDNHGELMFPRLRHILASCWGNYAWNKNGEFKLESHIITSNSVYRGRQVSDSNIQEYVSDIVSKYLPSDQPPWQYIIIPCVSSEPKYYVLVRVHHLLLTGKKSLNIGDMLMIEQLKPSRTEQQETSKQSPLTKLYPNPSAIPELWGRINEHLSNSWNEFISEYDPMESPRALKTLPGLFHVAGLIMIAGASALREIDKKRKSGSDFKKNPLALITTFVDAIQRECKRRSLTLKKIILSPLVTIDPRKWPFRTLNSIVAITRFFVNLPFRIWDEIACLIELKKTGVPKCTSTLIWKYAELVQLLIKASGEAWRGIVEIYRAPGKLWTDAIAGDDGKRNLLQTTSLCGRKVAAWSKPVPRADIEKAAKALGVSSTDIALYATTESLRAFFEQSQAEQPDVILTTARAASEDFLFTFSEGFGKDIKKSQTGGMICLALPVGATPRRIASVIESACKRQAALAGAWAAQARYGALTRAVPSPFARLTLNLLSRRYAVSYAEIDAPLDSRKRTTLWSQEVDYIVYWRPPQANISMSLTVLQYSDTVRLSVMTDARLSPHHIIPANRWSTAINQLVSKIDQELLRIAAHSSNVPKIVTTQSSDDITEETDSQNDEHQESSESMSMLKPPKTIISSPPPMRRNMTYH